jgi:hypothetical protein
MRESCTYGVVRGALSNERPYRDHHCLGRDTSAPDSSFLCRLLQRAASALGALGYLTPAAYAANLTATSDRLRNPDQLRRSHVALPAPDGVKPAETLIAAG